MKPVIGITSTRLEDVRPWTTFKKQAVCDDYIDAVVAAGGVPIILPLACRPRSTRSSISSMACS